MRMKLAWTLFTLILLSALGSIAVAQEEMSSDDLAIAVGNAQKANMAEIHKHTWKSDSELVKDGEQMASVTNEMRFDSEGEMDVTQLAVESHMKKQRGLRGRKQQSEMEEFQDYLINVLEHSYQYIFLSKGQMVDIFDGAEIKKAEKSIDVAAKGVFVDGDELHVAMAADTYLVSALSFTTTLGQDAIQGTVEMTKHESGLNTPSIIKIEVPGQALVITTETYDWTSQE